MSKHQMRVVAVVVLLQCVFASSTATAQLRAWFFSPPMLVEVNISDDGLRWSPGRQFTLPYQFIKAGPFLLAGGRYIVWIAALSYTDRIVVRSDTRTGEISTLPLPLQRSVFAAVERQSGRLVAADNNAVYAVATDDVATVTTWTLPAGTGITTSLAAGRGRLFVGRSFNGEPYTLVYDTLRGSLVGLTSGGEDGQVSYDERHYYAMRRSTTGYQFDVWDVQTLALTSEGAIDSAQVISPPKLVDEFLFTVSRAAGTGLHVEVADALSFKTVAAADLGWRYSARADLLHASSATPYFLYAEGDGGYSGCRLSITAISPDRSHAEPVEVSAFQASSPLACTAPLLVLARPDPPSHVRGLGSGRTVTLEWDAPANVRDYEIIAGSAAGLDDIGRFRTGGSAFATFNDVPSGLYYVRIRAINELGSSESDDVLVIVP